MKRLLAVAAIVLGCALAIVVGADGSPAWRVVRVLAAVAGALLVAVVILRGSRLAAGATALGAGIIGTAAGAGVALPHAAEGVVSVTTLAGFVCLIAGLVLLAGGAMSLVGGAHGWWRAPVAVTVVLVALPLLYSIGVAVAATNAPPTAVGDQTPADVGLAYRDVEFPTTDGVTLSGWYVPGDNGRAVVLLHGAGSTRSAVLDHAAVLAGHGYGVLLYDARGHGRSAGRAMKFGWHGDEDVGGAVAFLVAQPGVTGVAAVGMSMGGEQAIGAAASDPRIGAVVAEGATNRVAGDRVWLQDEYGIRGWLQRPVDWLTYTTTDVLTGADPPITLRAAVAATTSPVLLITAGDVADEALAGRYIASGSPGTVELWDVPDTGHTDALRTHPEDWESRVTAFLDEALGRSGG
jgi:pimeloyl-ACP methyl ester carboxylesterase